MAGNMINLPWDGTFLGAYTKNTIISKWLIERTNYYTLLVDYNDETGIIYCMMSKLKNNFPLIVEDIKPLFGISKRGIHTIKIQNVIHVLYYVPYNNFLLWETPLHKINKDNDLMNDEIFLNNVRRMWLFCDILALMNTKECQMRIRPQSIIHTNDVASLIEQQHHCDYSILPKTIVNKWFGERVSMHDMVKEMINYDGQSLVEITSNFRTEIEKIIIHHDNNFLWYTKFIVDRLSRFLMNDD